MLQSHYIEKYQHLDDDKSPFIYRKSGIYFCKIKNFISSEKYILIKERIQCDQYFCGFSISINSYTMTEKFILDNKEVNIIKHLLSYNNLSISHWTNFINNDSNYIYNDMRFDIYLRLHKIKNLNYREPILKIKNKYHDVVIKLS